MRRFQESLGDQGPQISERERHVALVILSRMISQDQNRATTNIKIRIGWRFQTGLPQAGKSLKGNL